MKKPQPGSYQDKALTYLKTGHSLDLPKALALFGICRLSAAVLELRKKGYDVRTTQVKTPEGNEFSFYTLPKVIDKDTRIGTRVRVTVPEESSTGKVGLLVCTHSGDDVWPTKVLLDGDKNTTLFAFDELEPEYLHA